jgi:hypothetical protein
VGDRRAVGESPAVEEQGEFVIGRLSFFICHFVEGVFCSLPLK